jgi:hypothetical protein
MAKLFAIAAVVIATLAGPVGGSSPAGAQVPLPHTVCTTTTPPLLTIIVTPGMHLLPEGNKDFEKGVEDPVTTCTASPTIPVTGWSGQLTIDELAGEGPMACLISGSGATGEIDVEFSDGDESTLDIGSLSGTVPVELLDILPPQADRVVVFGGTVEQNSDKFAGDHFVLVAGVVSPTPLTATLECLSPAGLVEFTSTFSLVFTD